MQIKLNHINLQTTQTDNMVDWYRKILKMEPGNRPNFLFDGVWLYTPEGDAAIHLVSVKKLNADNAKQNLKLEHFGFAATGMSEFESRLNDMNISFRRSKLPGFDVIQINLWDPDGNHLHLDFNSDE